jgi:hypothetical protein
VAAAKGLPGLPAAQELSGPAGQTS